MAQYKIVAILGLLVSAPLVLAGVAAAAGSGTAAKGGSVASIISAMRPMTVTLVRSAEPGCEPNCAEWIAAEGDFVEGTPALFERVLKSLGERKVPVFVNSGGGSIESAMAVGRMVRARGLAVSVTRTEFAPCAGGARTCGPNAKAKTGGPARGMPNSYNAYCASACTLLLAAGTERLASPWSLVGVHSIIVLQTQYKIRRTYRVTTMEQPGGGEVTHRTLIREQTIGSSTTEIAVSDGNYRPIEAYVREMEIDPSLVPLMEATANSSIHWMTDDEEASTRLVTRKESGDGLLAGLDRLPAEPAAIIAAPGRNRWHADADAGIRAEAKVPAFYQGRPVTLQFEARAGRTRPDAELSLSIRAGGEGLKSQGLVATFDFGGGRQVSGTNADPRSPFGPLVVDVSADMFCPLRQAGAVQISLHPAVPQTGVNFPLGEIRPVTMPVTYAHGFSEVLGQVCGAAARN